MIIKIKSILAGIVLTCLVAGCGLGCSSIKSLLGTTAPTDIIGKSEGVLVPSVNGAVSMWSDWVKGGHATQAQMDAVKTAYGRYYAAQLKASNVITAYMAGTQTNKAVLDAANDAVGSAQSNVVNLILEFKK